MSNFIKKLLSSAFFVGILLPALAHAETVDRFLCSISAQGPLGLTTSTQAHLTAIRRVENIDGMLYENAGDDLKTDIVLPSGVRVELWAQYTFKRYATEGSPWSLHTCMSGSVTDIFGNTSGWFCPNYYFPVSEKNGVPQFEGENGSSLTHSFEVDGEKIDLSCSLEKTT